MPIRLACQHLTKDYRTTTGRGVRALDDVSLTVEEGEFLTIVGSSGSGKSTLLRILAGIERPTTGSVTDFHSNADGRIGFVFQGNSVFPWRTVERNLTYSLEARGAQGEERQRQAIELCRLVGLEPETFLKKYPRELSGGESRRVAIGMALSAGASLLLFDEATSQLDYVSRLKLQVMVQALWLEKRPTAVYVTHDIDEAIILGGRIVVLSGGEIKDLIQINLPFPRGREVLAEPVCIELRERILQHLND